MCLRETAKTPARTYCGQLLVELVVFSLYILANILL